MLAHAFGSGEGPLDTRITHRWRRIAAPVVQVEACQAPRHGAALQRHHPVGDAGVEEGLGADDGAGAPGAVHHHGGGGIRCDVLDTVDQLAVGHAHGAGNGHARELCRGAPVQDDHVLAAPVHGRELLGLDTRGIEAVLHHLTKGLGRHVHPPEHLQARGAPGRVTAAHHVHLCVAHGFQACGGALRDAVAFVQQHRACAGPRHQLTDARLQQAVGQPHHLQGV